MQKKSILLLLFWAIVSLSAAYAQVPPAACEAPNIEVCEILISYDAAGNRTDRKRVCTCTSPESRTANTGSGTGNTTDAIAANAANAANAADGAGRIAKLYPNPTADALTLEFTTALTDATLIVTDGTGKAVARYTVSGNSYQLNLAALPGGLYYLNLQTTEARTVQKVVKL